MQLTDTESALRIKTPICPIYVPYTLAVQYDDLHRPVYTVRIAGWRRLLVRLQIAVMKLMAMLWYGRLQ